jgi:hypothetical protein
MSEACVDYAMMISFDASLLESGLGRGLNSRFTMINGHTSSEEQRSKTSISGPFATEGWLSEHEVNTHQIRGGGRVEFVERHSSWRHLI